MASIFGDTAIQAVTSSTGFRIPRDDHRGMDTDDVGRPIVLFRDFQPKGLRIIKDDNRNLE